ncbi:MAG: inositol monophosphatase family protein [Eubacteriales bacterium]|nr:inositol monophosphatase family protein [Eubacteriales bacterium]
MDKQLIDIIRKAGEIILQEKRPEVFTKEGHANFVTQTDINVQDFLKEKLSVYLPQASFFAEEQENNVLDDGLCFMIDPIDGTANYMRGRNFSCVSVALLKDKQPVLGLIFNPFSDELFLAEQEKGATLNDKKIKASEVEFENAIINFGTSPYYPEKAQATFEICKKLIKVSGDLRRTGSAALDLAELACGRTDLFFELSLSPWDYAAGALIAKEAGAIFDMPLLDKIDFSQKTCILAGNKLCFDKAKDIIQEHCHD